MKRLLVVDDDARTRRVIEILAERLGLVATAAPGAQAGLEIFRRERSDVIVTDLKMPGPTGLDLLRQLREIDADVPVIMLTAHGTVETAVDAMKLGAIDYLQKPFDVDALAMVIRRALDMARFRTENRFLRAQTQPASPPEPQWGRSPAMQEVLALVRKVAPARSTVLITGETGTGKEFVARAIHDWSPRKEHLFVPLNCTALPAELLESELFGHAKGAFSGAHAERFGRIQAADEGTLFLDEIGDMDVRLQAKLLRVLEEGVVEPLGTNRRVPVDVRIVAATNTDLARAMTEGRFREDLYFRLNVFSVHVPPLRDRTEDLPTLATALLATLGNDLGKRGVTMDAEALDVLRAYRWPGNVRELRNVLERAAVLCEGATIDVALMRSLLRPRGDASAPDWNLARAVAEVERRTIREALAAAGNNKAAAAKRLGIGERTLWTKLKLYGL